MSFNVMSNKPDMFKSIDKNLHDMFLMFKIGLSTSSWEFS